MIGESELGFQYATVTEKLLKFVEKIQYTIDFAPGHDYPNFWLFWTTLGANKLSWAAHEITNIVSVYK